MRGKPAMGLTAAKAGLAAPMTLTPDNERSRAQLRFTL
jgi:hypothetical protein